MTRTNDLFADAIGTTVDAESAHASAATPRLFFLLVADPDPDDDPNAVSRLAAELNVIVATGNAAAAVLRDNVRRARGARSAPSAAIHTLPRQAGPQLKSGSRSGSAATAVVADGRGEVRRP